MSVSKTGKSQFQEKNGLLLPDLTRRLLLLVRYDRIKCSWGRGRWKCDVRTTRAQQRRNVPVNLNAAFCEVVTQVRLTLGYTLGMERVTYQRVVEELNGHQVDYLVAGGVAVNLFGIPRMTADLDLLVRLERKNLERFLLVMAKLDFVPRLPVAAEDLLSRDRRRQWISEKNLKVFSFYHKTLYYLGIDVFIEYPVPFPAAYKRKVRQGIVPLVSLNDLIEMKRKAGRESDLADIRSLERIRDEK